MRTLLALLLSLVCTPSWGMDWWSFGTTESVGGGTVYGMPMGNDTTSGTASRYSCTTPVDDTIQEICAYLPTAPGVGKTRTIVVHKNETTDTTVTVTISDTNQSGCSTGAPVNFLGGTDRIAVKMSGTLFPSNTRVLYAVRHRTADNVAWMCGNSGDSAVLNSSTFYWPFAGTRQTADTTQYNGEVILPADATFRKLCIHATDAPGAGKSFTYTVVEKSGGASADQSVLVTLSDSEVNECDNSNTFTSVAQDSIVLKTTASGSPTEPFATWSIAYNPTTKNRYFIPMSVRDNANPATTDYAVAWGAEQSYSATESDHQEMAQVKLRILALYTEINVLDACLSWTITLRQNAASTVFATTHSAVNIRTDTGDVSIADYDLLNYSIVGSICGPGGGPTVHATLLVEGRERRRWGN